MKIKMELLSDVIFGNGMSVPGEEDISVLRDSHGFPYYKGGTLKGIFREELERYMDWEGMDEQSGKETSARLLGTGGEDRDNPDKLVFSDLTLSEPVKNCILQETGTEDPQPVLDMLTNIRTFTRIDESGMVEEGSLRSGRCVNRGLIFYGEIQCMERDEELVKNVLAVIKWIGSMRNRGFGKVRLSAV